MARFSRLFFVLSAVVGFSAGTATVSHAGQNSRVSDAPPSPSSSVKVAQVSYSGDSFYGPTSTYYTPYTTSYTPVTTVSYGYAPYYANYGSYGSGCACNQTSAYYGGYGYSNGCSSCGSCSSCSGNCSSCGSSGCSSCASGNCSAGYNSAPSTSGYGPSGVAPAPTPDPGYNNNSTYNNSTNRELNTRLNELEHQIRVLDHRQKEDEKFLDNQYKDKYAPSQYSSGSHNSSGSYYGGRSENVPARKKDSFDSMDQNYPPPRRPVPSREPVEQEVNRPNLGAPTSPTPADDTSKGKANDNGDSKEAEPQAMNLDNRITGKAIAPRERLQIVTKESKLQSVAKLNKPSVKTSEKKSSTELARH